MNERQRTILSRLAEQAAARIETGSANALLARRLLNESSLTVVTNDVFITRTFKNSEVNLVLLGVDGISPETGVTCSDMLRADVSSRAVSKSENTFIVTD